MHNESNPSTSYYWSPILYGRTYEVDFRMLAMPEYFDNEDRKWAEKYILPAMQNRNYILENQPRWVLIANEKYCVFASACMVEELFSEEQLEKEKEYTLDKSKSRRLYAFIGYVAKRDKHDQLPPLPKFEELNLRLFQDTYLELVRGIWYCRNSQLKAKSPIITYTKDINFSSNFVKDESWEINKQKKVIKVWSLEYNANLWNNCAFQLKTSNLTDNISLCLSLSKINLDKSPFSNVSVIDIKTTNKGDKIEKSFSKVQSKDKEKDLHTEKSTLNPKSSNLNTSISDTIKDVSQEKNLDHQQTVRKSKNNKGSDLENAITRIFAVFLSNPKVAMQFLMDKRINNSNNCMPEERHNFNLVEKSWDLLKFVVSDVEQKTYGEIEVKQDVHKLADKAGIDYNEMKDYLREKLEEVNQYIDEKVEEVNNFVLNPQDNRRNKKFESHQEICKNLGFTAVNNNNSSKELPSTKKQLDTSSFEDTESNKNSDYWF